jgi:hypothetical protein
MVDPARCASPQQRQVERGTRPYDGHVIARVPTCEVAESQTVPSPRQRRRTRSGPAATVATCADPRSRRAAAARAYRGARAADRGRGGETDQDRAYRGATVRVDIYLRRRRRTNARRRDGAARRERSRRGKARIHDARADRRRRRNLAVQLPAEPRAHKLARRDRGRLSRRAESRRAKRRCRRSRWRGCCSTNVALPPNSYTSSRAVVQRRERTRRPSRHRADHVHRLTRCRLGHRQRAHREEE